MTSNDNSTIYTLGDRGLKIDGSANDVRGREVKDKDGTGVGKVAELLVDERERKIRFMLVEHGGFLGFGDTKTLIPVEAVTKITEDDVFIDQSRDRVASAPGYAPDLIQDRPHHASVYDHYGYPQYSASGLLFPYYGPRPL